jgi:outer membrane biosynthesis protein TonB
VRRLITISIGLMFFGAMMNLTALAQDVQTDSTRKIVTRATPVYPELARKMNLEGSVKLVVAVAPNGMVKSVHTIGGNPVLVKAAEDSVYKYRWIPANRESSELVEMKFQRKQQ